ncbi:hypothetical protein ACA910_012981 [Epithemia clementina (nom. ined.)]
MRTSNLNEHLSSLSRKSSNPKHQNVYGAVEGEHYFLPLSGALQSQESDEAYADFMLSVSAANSTVASSHESDALLERNWTVAPASEYLQVQQPGDDDGCHSSCPDLIFEVLGFRHNPFRELSSNRKASTSRNTSAADLRLSMLSNFSTAYNILSISLSLKIMHPLYQDTFSKQNESLCSSALIAGMIVGQLAGGTLGDVLGRHRAMALVMVLQVSAALCSAVSHGFTVPSFYDCGDEGAWRVSIYKVLAVCRFILGVGAGGVYPLAATLTAESSQSKRDRAKSVALTFSFQGIGYLAVPLVTWIVVSIFGQRSDVSWRIILGLGALPGIILTVRRLDSVQRHKQNKGKLKGGGSASPSERAATFPTMTTVKNDDVEQQNISSASSTSSASVPIRRLVPVSVIDAIMGEKDLFRKLMGTGGCWLLFDILFYGNTLFQPVVLSAAFGSAETVAKAAQDTTLLALLALPGYFASVFSVGRLSPWFIQIQGFFVMGMLYLVIGILFHELAGQKAVLLLTYGATFFFSNYGPNATTFMLPSMTFSKHCRSTLNGVCAAMGKAGAFFGTVAFVEATNRFGQKAVFMACAVLSFIGCIVTLTCISPKTGVVELDQDDGHEEINEEEDGAVDDSDENSMAPPLRVSDEDLRDIVISSKVPMRVVVSHPSLMDYYSHQ